MSSLSFSKNMGDVSMGSCVMLPCSKEMMGSKECLREVLLLIREGKRQYPTNPQHKRIGNNRIDSHFPQRLSLRRVIIIIAPAIHQQPLRMQLHVTPQAVTHFTDAASSNVVHATTPRNAPRSTANCTYFSHTPRFHASLLTSPQPDSSSTPHHHTQPSPISRNTG